MNKLEKLIQQNNTILEGMGGHDPEEHDGLALSQTGFRLNCKRCAFLIADHAQRKRLHNDAIMNEVSQ